jgi:FKBP-type peptidyl-prolyl cis-trans isomerase
MKSSLVVSLLLTSLVSLAAAQERPVPPLHGHPDGGASVDSTAPVGSEFDTLEKRVGYALGLQLGRNLRQQDATIDVDLLVRGLHDGLAGVASPALTDSQIQHSMMEFQKHLQARAAKVKEERAAKNKLEGAAFLEKNKAEEGVKVTPSGLEYKVVKPGNGPKPVATDTVVVNYEGTLLDGTVFDSSYKRGQPATFGLGQVIRGWTEGLQLMEVGSTYMLYIPAELAYGDNPPPGPIGPRSVLTFKVELIEIKAGKAPAMPVMPPTHPGGH